MKKLAKLCTRHNWPHRHNGLKSLPQFYLFSDTDRLPDPGPLLSRLPRGACVVLRHTDRQSLAFLARLIIPQTRKLGLKVIIAGDQRLALRAGANGVHLSENMTRRGRPRTKTSKPGFFVTAAAHDRMAIWRASQAGADLIFLSPAFATKSHPDAHGLGVLRFTALARMSRIPVVALGGVTPNNSARLALGSTYGLAAIGAWRN